MEKSSQSTATMHNGLKDYHKTMFDVDPTFVWYKGKQTNPFELDALTSPKKWSTMLTKMKEFAHDIQPKPMLHWLSIA